MASLFASNGSTTILSIKKHIMSLNLCGSTGLNKGPIDCDVKRGIALVPILGGKVFRPSEYATQAAFEAALIAATRLITGNSFKLFPFPLAHTMTEKIPANKEATLGLGFIQTQLEGRPAYEINVLTCQLQFQNLRKWNRVTVPVFILDDQHNIWGKLNPGGTFTGINAYIYVCGNGFGIGAQNITAKIVICFLCAADFHDNSAFISVPAYINLTEVKNKVLPVIAGCHTSNVWHISGNIVSPEQAIASRKPLL
jgi:hypothetical protein